MMKFLDEEPELAAAKAEGPQGDDSGARREGQSDQQGYLTVAPREKSIKRGTILLAVVFGAGLLGLLVMVKKTNPLSAAAKAVSEDTQIEAAVSKLIGIKTQFLNRMDQIVKKFHELSDVEQVEVYELRKNPFMYEKGFKPLTHPADLRDAASLNESNSAIIQSKLLRQVEKMQLFSIMESAGGRCCMIDDKLLRPGEDINGFQVVGITPNSVELRAEGMQFILRIPAE
jgi:preprotein translocase subunit SecG